MTTKFHVYIKIGSLDLEKFKKIVSWCNKYVKSPRHSKNLNYLEVDFLGSKVKVPGLDFHDLFHIKKEITQETLKNCLYENCPDDWYKQALYMTEIVFDINGKDLHLPKCDKGEEWYKDYIEKTDFWRNREYEGGFGYNLFLFNDVIFFWSNARSGGEALVFSRDIIDEIKKLAKLVDGEIVGPDIF